MKGHISPGKPVSPGISATAKYVSQGREREFVKEIMTCGGGLYMFNVKVGDGDSGIWGEAPHSSHFP